MLRAIILTSLNGAPSRETVKKLLRTRSLESLPQKLKAMLAFETFLVGFQSLFHTCWSRLSIVRADQATDALPQCRGTLFYIKIMLACSPSFVSVSDLSANPLLPLFCSISLAFVGLMVAPATLGLGCLRHGTLVTAALRGILVASATCGLDCLRYVSGRFSYEDSWSPPLCGILVTSVDCFRYVGLLSP